MKICFGSYNLIAHKLCLSTKYYKTYVLMFECEDFNSIPSDVKNKIEGAIFYFDCSNLNFSSELEALLKFIRDNNIGVSTIITRNLSESTFHELNCDLIANKCKHDINVIDLNVKMDLNEPVGYAEVIELLKNHVWSNVHISSPNCNKIFKSEENDANAEEAIEEFEELLNKFQQFKDVSKNFNREEILQNAEDLAELFVNILSKD